ncbi:MULTISPECIES: hypothetical protein [unclassified Streptomyces]
MAAVLVGACHGLEVLSDQGDFEVTGEVRRLRSDFINGIKHLPVRFG